MSTRWCGMLAAWTAVLWASLAWAQTLRRESILEKQEKQEQVRAMARELVSGIVDLQLRQLEENGMEKTDLYRELRSMRANLDKLVEAEMPRVVQLLMRLLEEPAAPRPETFLAARQKSREVLIQLLIERQNLLRRLRIAELAAQVRKLIESETRLYDTTRALPELLQARREEATLAAVQDQRDIREVYVRLVDLLREVTGWGGPAAGEAAKALGVLSARKTDAEFEAAIRHLDEARYPEAAASQEAILKALAELLEAIQRAQGLLNPDSGRESAEHYIRQVAEKQKALRAQTEQADLTQTPEAQELAHQQSEIGQQLEELLRAAENSPEVHASLQQAEESAQKAAEHIFESRKPEALAQQNRVLENLEKAADQARQAGPLDQPAVDAQRLVEDLLAAREDLRKIEQQQKETTPLAEQKPQEAGPREKEVAARLAEVPKDRQLPAPVGAAVEQARQAAEHAAQAMERLQAGLRRQAARSVEQAIQRALAEVDQALADLRRERLGAEAAQLAQAAAQLEKAAARQQQIAKTAEHAARSQGFQAEEARRLGQEQAGVQALAQEAVQAIERAVPEAARLVGEAKPAMEESARELQSARSQPGEASKPAAERASQQASQAADKLAQAAAEARKAAAAAAEQLAQEAARQLQAARNAEQGVEKALAHSPQSLAHRLQRLAQAAQEVQRAQAEQARAAGHPQAAAAMELAAGIRKALEAQDAADRAAQAAAQHQPGAPLHQAVARQQEVAQMAAELAQQAAAPSSAPPQAKPEDTSPPPAAQALRQAEQSAQQAAKELLSAQPESSAQSRAQTRKALQHALELADSQAHQALEAPPGPKDMEAQARTGQTIARAEQLVQPDAPRAGPPLQQAAESSQAAQEHGRQGDAQAADNAQAATRQSLEEAARQIAEARNRLAQEAAQQMAGQAQAARQLADQAAPVDAGATGALHQAENEAGQAAAQPAAVPAAVPAFEQAMNQAAAELAQRRTQLAQQQALAQRLAQAAAQPDAGDLMAQLAQQMAGEMGPEAAAELASAQPSAASQMPGQRPSDEASPQGTGGMARAGQQTINQPRAQADAQPNPHMPQGDSRTGDAANPAPEATRRLGREEPWHADLPPEIRSAIRANAQRRPPRGYEEKLERYFKNID